MKTFLSLFLTGHWWRMFKSIGKTDLYLEFEQFELSDPQTVYVQWQLGSTLRQTRKALKHFQSVCIKMPVEIPRRTSGWLQHMEIDEAVTRLLERDHVSFMMPKEFVDKFGIDEDEYESLRGLSFSRPWGNPEGLRRLDIKLHNMWYEQKKRLGDLPRECPSCDYDRFRMDDDDFTCNHCGAETWLVEDYPAKKYDAWRQIEEMRERKADRGESVADLESGGLVDDRTIVDLLKEHTSAGSSK